MTSVAEIYFKNIGKSVKNDQKKDDCYYFFEFLTMFT